MENNKINKNISLPLKFDHADCIKLSPCFCISSINYHWTQKYISQTINTPIFELFMFVLLIYVIFIQSILTLCSINESSSIPINITLIVSILLFFIEMILSIFANPDQNKLYLILESIGIVSIFFEISWVQEIIGISNMSKVEIILRTAAITRAGRVTRFIKIFHFIRTLKIFIFIRYCFKDKTNNQKLKEEVTPSSLGSILTDRISISVTCLVILTIMAVILFQINTTDNMIEAYMSILSIYSDTTREILEPIVFEMKSFVEEIDHQIYVQRVAVNNLIWDWTDEHENILLYEKDRSILYNGYDKNISVYLDITLKNKHKALLDILLSMAIIFELCIFMSFLHFSTYNVLVKPLERVFETIKKNASSIVCALETASDNMENSEIYNIEVAINKMTGLLAHITSLGNHGNHFIDNYIQDEITKSDTKGWHNEFLKNECSMARKITNLSHDHYTKYNRKLKIKNFNCHNKEYPEIFDMMKKINLNFLDSWDWDVTMLTTKEIMASICMMFFELKLVSYEKDLNNNAFTTLEIFINFLRKVHDFYNDVPYHNFYHCCDVVHATYKLINILPQKLTLNSLEKFGLMIAALCHDIDHPGFNNTFLINSKHKLATLYNDKSVLENSHVSCLYKLVNENPECDIFQFLEDSEWREVRKIIIEAILHTDMINHFPMISRLEVLCELHAPDFKANKCENIFKINEECNLMINSILHCADISNSIKPIPICEKWADRVLKEFFHQGDIEKECGLPISPMCDRDKTSKPISQINFIEFIVAPIYYQVFIKIMTMKGESFTNF